LAKELGKKVAVTSG